MLDIKNYKINNNNSLVGLKDFGSKVSAEGVVLLKNDNNLLPLNNKEIALFGRTQTDYYKSGTGSGGLVNVLRVLSIRDALLENPTISLNKDLMDVYDEWLKDNPFNAGDGSWASEPWCQVEMEVSNDLVKKIAKQTDTALVIIARTAGEDIDNFNEEGSYLLTKTEEDLLEKVSSEFKNVIVVLNVGNVIDMTFMDNYNITSALYIWHGGSLGARGAVDVLTGHVTPSGRLVDTIAKNINDFPSTKNFGDKVENIYQEDIYVGYRYFNTFAQDAIRYPFGFGLSYTSFEQKVVKSKLNEKEYNITIKVTNVGRVKGKEVVQIYCNPAMGQLGRPHVELVGFGKTKTLSPNESQEISLKIDINKIATFDDFGVSGFKDAYVLEKGEYNFYVAKNSIELGEIVDTLTIKETKLVEQLRPMLSPVKDFKVMKATKENGKYKLDYVPAPKRSYDLESRYVSDKPKTIEQTNEFITLEDVFNKKKTMDEFIGSLSDDLLASICRGEGMSSPKVTPGAASAFGGCDEDLLKRKVPVMCAADGPSGIRLDSKLIATSLPNGTNLACTFDFDLVCELYQLIGMELRNYTVDVLLGPGMNIHRNPLNGRNFEYFSEDPLITGMFAAAFTYGVQSKGGSGTLKHFACNNQEVSRSFADAVVSQRAMREIYLKGYEIAIKMAKSRAIMTAYNPINGIWSASNHDLNYNVCRNEWGFDGIIMTDWWANLSEDQGEPLKTNTRAMIRATNDLYMVVSDAKANSSNDNTVESLNDKSLDRSYAQLCAKNICNYALQSKSFYKLIGKELKDQDYKLNNWFEASNVTDTMQLLKSVKVNNKEVPNFNPIVNSYYFDEKITSVVADKGEVLVTDKVATVTLDNNKYYFVNAEYKIIQFKVALDLMNFDKVKDVKDNFKVNLNDYSYMTRKVTITDESVTSSNNQEYFTYPLNFVEDGTYEIKYTYECQSKILAQVPFILFLDNTNIQTIIVGSSNGKKETTSTVVDIKKGQYQFSTQFTCHGLTIYDIEFTKK